MRAVSYVHGVAVLGAALLANVLRDAYTRARDVCELFPQFELLPTFLDELLLHQTPLPVVATPVATAVLAGALLATALAAHLGLVELLWLWLVDVFSGRWIYNLAFVQLPAWLPFLASEPGVPDLLSDPEDAESLDGDAAFAAARNATAAAECAAAMAKLVEVKRQHAHCAIERPDDWLVFDPEEDELVTKKDLEARRLRRAAFGSGSSTESSTSSSSSSSSTATSTASPAPSPSKKWLSPEEEDDHDQGHDVSEHPSGEHQHTNGYARRAPERTGTPSPTRRNR